MYKQNLDWIFEIHSVSKLLSSSIFSYKTWKIKFTFWKFLCNSNFLVHFHNIISFWLKPSNSLMLHNFPFVYCNKISLNIVSFKNACAMWKVLMVQNCDNDILKGLVVANPPQPTHNPLFLSWRHWRL
jgi:hypothetical protein